MNTLVTGASGFVGSHLVKRLGQAGHQVYALVRSSSNLAALQPLAAKLVYGDVRDKASLERIVQQYPAIDTVFHLASVLTPVSVDDSLYWDINYQGTQNLLEVCRQASLKAFIQCSSVGVIGPLPTIPADETARCAPDSNYGKSKYQAEQLALQYHQQFGLPVAVVRPAWIYGPGDRRTYKFFRMVARGRFFLIGSGQTQLSPVYVDDVVQGLILCADQIEQAAGEVFIVAGPTTVSLETLASTIAQEAGTSILPVKVPAGIARLGATLCETLCKPLGIEPPIHRRRLDFFCRDQAFDTTKIRQTLGFQPRIDLPTGVKSTITWYQQQGWLP
ncbi:NAD-dependent epimerase/dehydratase family protein [candidate division KSB3 bacterium]|uniref:NAD-dependent epimerase/dehydratase family protein n=1 Tax=candidate division KSB3 bacterium TaxID=2044937 RepID=A0A9D5JXI8_9BACT|nr:NAD-dependent epimerase/dehydratase family protein [candidate division KSB3 bacterium]MBD3326063.1 NAD-dependent epimerase/dehydratase family protein [candidate division KSB3 bacterium]